MNTSRTLLNNMTAEGVSAVSVGACIILALSFLVGTPGNLLVIWTILRHVKQRSHTVVLILHLAVADLLVLITLPLWMYSLPLSWVFGEATCKAIVYLICSCMYSSVFIITVMSVERFLAVRYPVAFLGWKSKKNVLSKVLLVLWSAAFLLGVPMILTQVLDDEGGEEQCLYREYSSARQQLACLLVELLLGFVVPFSVLTVCYGYVLGHIKQMTFKTKQKSNALIGAVVAAFLMCWLPRQVVNVLTLVSVSIKESSPNTASALEAARDTVKLIAEAMGFISSSVNPLLYAFAARYFQGSFRVAGIRRLFRNISDSGTDDRDNELSVVSRIKSSQNKSVKGSTDTKESKDVDLTTHEDISS